MNEEIEAQKQLAKYSVEQQAAIESAYNDAYTQMAEYVREFSEDKTFQYTEKGRLEGGHIPQQNKEDYWSEVSPNFVFSKFTEQDQERIDNMHLVLDTQLSMYKVNYELLNRMREIIRAKYKDNPKNHIQLNLELKGIDRLQQNAEYSIRRMINRENQQMHLFAKTKRANVGQPGAERMAMVSKAIMSDRPGRAESASKGGGIIGWARRNLGRGKQ